MRDDFPANVKEELAKRVGYACSNPGCRQATSGPQDGPAGTVNVGVAAHITAASLGGPRYDSNLTPEERTSAANGVWLCQTCAKLIDSDVQGFTEVKIIEWKSDAETAARRALEQRRSPPFESEGVFREAERLMPALMHEMRSDVCGDETELVRVFCVLPSRSVGYSYPKAHFFYIEEEHPGLQLQIDWLEEMGLLVDITPANMPVYRMTPEFVRWLRTPS
jgi:hypothetical protein